MVSGDNGCAAERATNVTLRGAESARAPLVGAAALGESAGWEFASGGAFCAVSLPEPWRSGPASALPELVIDRFVIAGDGPIGPNPIAECSACVLSD